MDARNLPFLLALATAFTFAGCSDTDQSEVLTEQYTDGFPAPVEAEQQGSAEMTYHNIQDPKTGMVASRIPLPSNWKLMSPQSEQEPHVVGPNGIKVYYRNGGSHAYSNDPYIQESYRMSGNPMRPPVSIEQLVQQEFLPALTQQGLRPVRQYPLPEVARRNQQYAGKLYKAMPSQDAFFTLGTEWTDKDGKPILIIVNQTISQGQNDVFWYYNMQVMESQKEVFEQAKRTLINGIVNTQDNPQQIAAYNANEQQKSNQSWAQHNAKMQQNQANFDRQQAIHRSTSDAVNNSIIGTWRAQNESSDRGQRDFINTIRGEETVTDPMDGNQYQVGSGADQYWMNNSGEYIQSNDAYYDPNGDNSINNQVWQEVTPE